MAIAKKGLRTIIVRDEKYYWKFNERIFVYDSEHCNSLLIIDFGWYDVWDYVNNKDNVPPDFEPRIATPKFVSESIEFALDHGWEEGKMEIQF